MFSFPELFLRSNYKIKEIKINLLKISEYLGIMIIIIYFLCQLKSKLNRLHHVSKNTYEMDQFPRDCFYSSCDLEGEKFNFDTTETNIINNTTPTRTTSQQIMLTLRQLSESDDFAVSRTRSEHERQLREVYEKQVRWIMDGDGEEFVSMETFSRFTDALILLEVLKEFNVPSVVSFLARRDEPIALTFSKTKIGLDCLMFCLFQA